jgi:uncharacterized DUF497 family protein
MGIVSRCEWDAGNLVKCQKHGVTIAEIEQVLDGDPFLYPDYDHSQIEERNIAVGTNGNGRLIIVIFTLRMSDGREWVRPISARYMHRKEIEKYDQLRRQEGPSSADR